MKLWFPISSPTPTHPHYALVFLLMNLRYNKDIPNPNNLFFTQQNTIKYPFVCACMSIYYINTYFFLNTCNSLNYKRRDFTHYQGVMGVQTWDHHWSASQGLFPLRSPSGKSNYPINEQQCQQKCQIPYSWKGHTCIQNNCIHVTESQHMHKMKEDKKLLLAEILY